MPFIYPHVALMPDAHLGHRRDRRFGDPDRSGDHARRRRGRHRLRDDRGPNAVHRRRPAARPLAALREAIERAVPLSAGAANQTISGDTPSSGSRTSGLAAAPASTRTAYAGDGELQLGTLGSGNHFIEVTARRGRAGCGCSCTPARAASATDRRSSTSRSPGSCASGGGSSCPTATSPTSPRARTEFWRLHPRDAVGADLRAAQPRGDDGPGRRQFGAAPTMTWSGGGDQLPPQLHRAGDHYGRTGSPARA